MPNKLTRDELKTFIMLLIKTEAEGMELANQCKDLKKAIESVNTEKALYRKPKFHPETLPLKKMRSYAEIESEQATWFADLPELLLSYPGLCAFGAIMFAAAAYMGMIPWVPVIIIVAVLVILVLGSRMLKKINADAAYEKEKKAVKKYNEVTRVKKIEENKRINAWLLEDWNNLLKEEDEKLKERLLYRKKLQVNLDKLSSAYFKNTQLFEKLIGMRIVHEKYAGLSTLFVMWDLLDTGRTHSLERDGADPGAYNMVDSQEYQRALYQMIDRNFSSIITELRTLKYEMKIISDQNNRMMGLMNDVYSGIEHLSETAKKQFCID